MELPDALEPLFSEIEGALDAKLYLVAVLASLTVPDVCAVLANPNFTVTRSSGGSYKAWCEENLDMSKSMLFKSTDIYSLRCRALHSGSLQNLDKGASASRIILVPDGRLKIFDCQLGDAYTYSAEAFCREFVNAGRRWASVNRNNNTALKKAEQIFCCHPNGIPPYIVGVPVIG